MMELEIQHTKGQIDGWIAILAIGFAAYAQLVNSYENTMILYVIICGIIILNVVRTPRGKNHLIKILTSKGIWLMMILVLFACVWNTPESLQSCIYQLLSCILAITAGYMMTAGSEKDDIDKFWFKLAIFLAIGAIYGVVEYFTHINYFFTIIYTGTFDGTGTTGRITSWYLHPIPFAHAMIYGFAIALYKIKNTILKYSLLIIFSFVIIASGSRSAWIVWALLILMWVYQYIKRYVRKRTFIVGIVGFVFLLVLLSTDIATSLFEFVDKRLGSAGASISNEMRSNVYDYFFHTLFNRGIFPILFGNGFGQSTTALDSALFESMAVDNTFLQIMYDYGVIAFLLLAVLIIKWIIQFIQSRKSTDDKTVIAILLSNVLMSCFYDSIGWKSVSVISFMIIGMWMYGNEERRWNN